MRKLVPYIAIVAVTIVAPLAASNAMDHGKMMSEKAGIAHEEVVQGVKASVKIISMKERMREMGMEMPQGVKETHHLMIDFKDQVKGSAFTKGEVKLKVQRPDRTDFTKDLIPMGGMAGMGAHFGADVDLSAKGKYGIMAKFRLDDGKERTLRFWYEVK